MFYHFPGDSENVSTLIYDTIVSKVSNFSVPKCCRVVIFGRVPHFRAASVPESQLCNNAGSKMIGYGFSFKTPIAWIWKMLFSMF